MIAKQYHPDRNPGKETEVVAKFQAVQAAHEILSDPAQRAKYDRERASIKAAESNPLPPTTRTSYRTNPKPRPPPPSDLPFPPPPRRTGPQTEFKNPFDNAQTRPKPQAAQTPGAESYNAYSRAGQNWDKAYAEAKNRAQAGAAMRNMGHQQPNQQMPAGFQHVPGPPPRQPPPPQPTRPTGRYPTAPRPAETNSSSDNTPRAQRSWERPTTQPEPQPGFPGMARTASSRKRPDYAPQTPAAGPDMPKSAYAYVRGAAKPAPPPTSNPYFPDTPAPQSPQARPRNTSSPLRQSKSSEGMDEASQRPARPNLERVSTRYASRGGEKTFLGNGMNRSASVRNSPIEPRMFDNGEEALHRSQSHEQHHHHHHHRHHSEGPTVTVEEEEESADDASPNHSPKKNRNRPDPAPQQGRGGMHSNTDVFGLGGYRTATDDDPALTGQFSKNNYKTGYKSDDLLGGYRYPPPSERNVNTGRSPRPQTNGTGPPYSAQEGPRDDEDMYVPFPVVPSSESILRDWRAKWYFPAIPCGKFPAWALPGSISPSSLGSGMGSDIARPSMHGLTETTYHPFGKATPNLGHNLTDCDSSSQNHAANGNGTTLPFHTVSHENINTSFSAADWDGKFTSGDEMFRPPDLHSRDRGSPTKTSRARAQSTGRGRAFTPDKERRSGFTNADREENQTSEDFPDVSFSDSEGAPRPKSEAFKPGRFSADEWAEKMKTWDPSAEGANFARPKTPAKRGSKSSTTKKAPSTSRPFTVPPNDNNLSVNGSSNTSSRRPSGDAMDIDGELSSTKSSPNTNTATNGHASQRRTSNSAINMSDFGKAAPFAPSGGGINNVNDLHTNLPFESRASASHDPRAHTQRTNTNTSTASSRELRLPKPPKAPQPPSDFETSMTQATWDRYCTEMRAYFTEWNVFNNRMIDHFRTRQEQVDLNMSSHWMSSIGDGPVEVSEPGTGDVVQKAGYRTFMNWMDEDAKCRDWWEVACEKHRECFETLGNVRHAVKVKAGIGD